MVGGAVGARLVGLAVGVRDGRRVGRLVGHSDGRWDGLDRGEFVGDPVMRAGGIVVGGRVGTLGAVTGDAEGLGMLVVGIRDG